MIADFKISANGPRSEHTLQNEDQPASPKVATWIPNSSFAVATILCVPIVLYFSTLNPSVRIFPITIETFGPCVVVSGVWVKLQRWASGQHGVNPVVTLLITLGAPMAAREIVNSFCGRLRS